MSLNSFDEISAACIDINDSNEEGDSVYKFSVPKTIKNIPELPVIELIAGMPIPNGLFVDAGAHLGFYTIMLSAHFERVVSFEPSTWQRDLLRRNLSRNDIRNCQIREEALGSVAGVSNLNVMGLSGGSNTLLPATRDKPPMETYSVDVITLDSLRYQDLVFLKIDVEGWELEVLRGASETIQRCSPVILLEVWDISETRRNVGEFLSNLAYSFVFPYKEFPELALCQRII